MRGLVKIVKNDQNYMQGGLNCLQEVINCQRINSQVAELFELMPGFSTVGFKCLPIWSKLGGIC